MNGKFGVRLAISLNLIGAENKTNQEVVV